MQSEEDRLPREKDGSINLKTLAKDKIWKDEILTFPDPKNHRGICAITEEMPLHLLYSAYMQGIFPWFCEDEGEPVIWYSPEPRFCIFKENFHVPKSISRFLKHTPYTYTIDKCFTRVMEECRDMQRAGQSGTWIGPKMIETYTALHKAGYAHSVEVWQEGELAGGFYGELFGSIFCGESMFTKASDSSKSAFVLFAKAFFEAGGQLIDSQVYTDNIARYGATNISRLAFLRLEKEFLHKPLEKDIKEFFDKV